MVQNSSQYILWSSSKVIQLLFLLYTILLLNVDAHGSGSWPSFWLDGCIQSPQTSTCTRSTQMHWCNDHVSESQCKYFIDLNLALYNSCLLCAFRRNEYRKYVEKDKALERRFQQVYVGEPSPEDTVSILRGLKPRYELHHGVRIRDEALLAAAKLSSRYLPDRFLPDKGKLVQLLCNGLHTFFTCPHLTYLLNK